MPTYEWRGAGPFRDAQNDRTIDPGGTVELDAHVGDPQKEMVRVTDPDPDSGEGAGGEADDNSDEATDSDDTGFDAAVFVDRTPMDVVIADIETGDYDDHLDAIEAVADRVGVQDAVDARRHDRED